MMTTVDRVEVPNNHVEVQDLLLASYVRVVNQNEAVSLDVTVIVGGMMLTGNIVSGREYLKAIGESWASATFTNDQGSNFSMSEELKAELRKAYDDAANAKYPLRAYDEKNDDVAEQPPLS